MFEVVTDACTASINAHDLARLMIGGFVMTNQQSVVGITVRFTCFGWKMRTRLTRISLGNSFVLDSLPG